MKALRFLEAVSKVI